MTTPRFQDSDLVRDLQDWIDHSSWEIRRQSFDEQACWDRLVSESPVAFRDGDSPNEGPLVETEGGETALRFLPLKHLGAGGFGVVIQAKDLRLDRNVAIKMLRPSLQSQPRLLQRFMREAKAVASLNHHGIVPVYETGSIGGIPFIAVELVDGPSLAKHLESHSETFPEQRAAWLVREVAKAVQYAHSRGILHRDLKPSNILLAPVANQETYGLGFEPKLTDFGLAKRLGELTDLSQNLTTESVTVGTIRYMSPELIRGDQDNVTVTSDIFSLGIILYQLVTGHLPFEGTSYFEISDKICRHAPTHLRKIVPSISRDLEAVILKCLHKDSAQRYQSAGELVHDLDRLLQGIPVNASRPSFAKSIRYWARTSPRTFFTATAALTIVLVAMVAVYSAWLRERDALRRVEENLAATLQAIDSIVFPVTEAFNDGRVLSRESNEDILSNAVAFQEAYLRNNPDDLQALHRLSVAHNHCSNGYMHLRQIKKAYDHRMESIRILRELLEKDPANRSVYHYQLFFGYHRLAWIPFEEVEEVFKEGTRIREDGILYAKYYLDKALEDDPENVDYLDARNAILFMQLSVLKLPDEEFVEIGERLVESSLDLWEKYPEKSILAKYAVSGNLRLAIHALQQGECEKADQYMIRHDEIFQLVFADAEQENWYTTTRVENDLYRAVTTYRCGRLSEAEKYIDRAVTYLEKLKRDRPDHRVIHIFGLAIPYVQIKIAERKQGQPKLKQGQAEKPAGGNGNLEPMASEAEKNQPVAIQVRDSMSQLMEQ